MSSADHPSNAPTEFAAGRKQAMLASRATQTLTLAPLSGSVERFRRAPAYDCREPEGLRLDQP
ncbi:hypothetical protein MPLSOD_50132 [Mesorhizobium sp. SOD10]|nr:hypothetical protein MPLSOD_50132 [Mesorhizobium sp. SOD10]